MVVGVVVVSFPAVCSGTLGRIVVLGRLNGSKAELLVVDTVARDVVLLPAFLGLSRL